MPFARIFCFLLLITTGCASFDPESKSLSRLDEKHLGQQVRIRGKKVNYKLGSGVELKKGFIIFEKDAGITWSNEEYGKPVEVEGLLKDGPFLPILESPRILSEPTSDPD